MTSIDAALRRLGITAEHIGACRLPLQQEAPLLADAGPDAFNRPAMMTPATFAAWRALLDAAAADGITLELVSAFRSIKYQCDVIERKLATGRPIGDILRVNAIPGYSEHHTGRALDLNTPGCEPLTAEFEQTRAFAWLMTRARDFAFTLSYPRGNPQGIDYEPWHWAHAD